MSTKKERKKEKKQRRTEKERDKIREEHSAKRLMEQQRQKYLAEKYGKRKDTEMPFSDFSENKEMLETLDMHKYPYNISEFIERSDPITLRIKKGFVPNMNVEGICFANEAIYQMIMDEERDAVNVGKHSNLNKIKKGKGRLTSLKQIANVAGLPGIVGKSLAMPDVHCGYGFAIGNVAAVNYNSPESVVSPGGVGFDINCGVRLIKTCLKKEQLYERVPDHVDLEKLRPKYRCSHGEDEVHTYQSLLAEMLANEIHVGVGGGGACNLSKDNFERVLKEGMKFLLEEGVVWKEDLEYCEENGCMKFANPNKVSDRAKKRGIGQLGSLGSGNHYAEVQIVDEIFDEKAAEQMGLFKGQVVIMLHSGSRGLGHQVCSDYLQYASKWIHQNNEEINDRQLAYLPILSDLGQDYLAAMAAAANYAWCSRSIMTHTIRKVFSEVFDKSPEELEMHLVYDVSHNIAKLEEHEIVLSKTMKSKEIGTEEEKGNRDEPVINPLNSQEEMKLTLCEEDADQMGMNDIPDKYQKTKVTCLVHRKGATRAFGPNHSDIPEKYKEIGQPVLIGGSMGSCSYVLTGTQKAMDLTFGSTCHGAGRALSRSAAMRQINSYEMLAGLSEKGIDIKVAKKKMAAEEAPDAYKDVSQVVNTCEASGISKKCARMVPVVVIKGLR